MENKLIFYTDDDIDDQEFFTDVIKTVDNTITVHLIDNGETLLEELKQKETLPHLLFLDINMPGLNGLQVLQEIRQNEFLNDLPVIMLSTSNDSEMTERSENLGANMFVTKPSVYNEFTSILTMLVNINWKEPPKFKRLQAMRMY